MCAQIKSDGSELRAKSTFDLLRGEIEAWSPDLNTKNATPHADRRQTLQKIAEQTTFLDKDQQKKLAGSAVDRIVAVMKDHDTWGRKVKDLFLPKRRKFKTVNSVIAAYKRMTAPVLEVARTAAGHGLVVVTESSAAGQKRRQGEDHKSDPSKRVKPDKSARFEKVKKKQNQGARTERVNAVTKDQGSCKKAKGATRIEKCNGCGRKGHSASECEWKQHPDWNKTSSPWSESETGKATHDKWGKSELYPSKTLKDDAKAAWTPIYDKIKVNHGGRNSGGEPSPSGRAAWELSPSGRVARQPNPSGKVSCYLSVDIEHTDHSFTSHRALIDSGATHNNYVSWEVEALLVARGSPFVPVVSSVDLATAGSRQTANANVLMM